MSDLGKETIYVSMIFKKPERGVSQDIFFV